MMRLYLNDMRIKKILFLIPLLIIPFFFFTNKSLAQEKESISTITVINPIRGKDQGHEKDDLLASLKAQWKVTHDAKIDATWLWQYTALEDEGMVNFAKNSMPGQEFGLFFEIDKNSAPKAGVQYRGQGPSYFSDGLFLMSYDVYERKKLIDSSFAKFKEKFGYYPKTVGAWWIGGDSLSYMQKKYGIVAAMKASEQFDMDVYSLWGTPWSIPYVASVENQGIPASDWGSSSRVVILQWAERDPTRGYQDAMYSVQDRMLEGYSEYLWSTFLRKPADNIIVGLENGDNLAGFEKGFYKKAIDLVRKFEDNKKAKTILAKDYAEDFLARKKIFSDSDTKYFLTKAYESKDQSFWYNSANFRAGIHKMGDEIYLVDLRDYSKKVDEDYSLLPNSQGYLRLTMPAVIDSIRFPDQKLLIANSKEPMKIIEAADKVVLFSGDKKMAQFTKTSVDIFTDKNGEKAFFFVGKQGKPEFIDRTFLFDKKELLLLILMPVLSFLPIPQALFIIKIFSLLLLLVALAIFMIKKSWGRPTFYFVLVFVFLLYARAPYFPLDRSTYTIVASIFAFIGLVALVLSIVVFRKKKSKKVLLVSLIGIPVALAILGGIVVVSRSQFALVPFELDALQVIKNKHKDVVLISEINYEIKPIYKEVKPLLYEDYHFGEKLTGTHWQVVKRAENNVTKLSDYHRDKVIVAPRYLGADFSDHEMKVNGLKKIFDNGQIAIFEKK